MKNIDELISNITLKDEDYADIEPISLDEKAYNNIVNNTLKEIHKDSSTEKKSKKKNMRSVLLVAAILTVSTTILAASHIVTIEEVFNNIFGRTISNIGSSGQVIDASVITQGIEMKLEGLVNDENLLDLVFNIHKESNEPFMGETIEFEEFTIETADSNHLNDNEVSGTLASTHCQEIDLVVPNTNERRFRLTSTTSDEVKNGEATLKLSNIIERKNYLYTSQLNLAKWLREHPQDVTLIANNDIRLKSITDQNKLEELNIPEQIIDSQNVNLQLFEESSNLQVVSIAFVNSKLHIKIDNLNDMDIWNEIYFQDVNGEIVKPIYSVNTGHATYYVFDIDTVEALEGLKIYGNVSKVVNTINGTWEIKFNLNTQNHKMILQPCISIPLSLSNDLYVKEVQVSNLSLMLFSNKLLKSSLQDINININFKSDDTTLHINHTDVHTSMDTKDLIIYTFDKPINIQDIDTISINGIVIN